MTSKKNGKPTPKELLALRGSAAVRPMGQRFPPPENTLEQGRSGSKRKKRKKKDG